MERGNVSRRDAERDVGERLFCFYFCWLNSYPKSYPPRLCVRHFLLAARGCAAASVADLFDLRDFAIRLEGAGPRRAGGRESLINSARFWDVL